MSSDRPERRCHSTMCPILASFYLYILPPSFSTYPPSNHCFIIIIGISLGKGFVKIGIFQYKLNVLFFRVFLILFPFPVINYQSCCDLIKTFSGNWSISWWFTVRKPTWSKLFTSVVSSHLFRYFSRIFLLRCRYVALFSSSSLFLRRLSLCNAVASLRFLTCRLHFKSCMCPLV